MGGSGGAADPPRIWGSCLIQNNNLCPLVDSQNIWICICFRSSAECLSMFRALRGAFVALGKSFLGSAAKRQPQSKYNTTEWKTRKWTSPTNHKKPCGISGKASATNKENTTLLQSVQHTLQKYIIAPTAQGRSGKRQRRVLVTNGEVVDTVF